MGLQVFGFGKCSGEHKEVELISPFYVLEYGTHRIIGYSRLKKLRLFVNYVLDSLVRDDEDRVLCNVVKIGNKEVTKKKEEKEKTLHSILARISLIRDVSGVKGVQRGNRLLLPLASLVVLSPKYCVMIISSFTLNGNGIQNITSVCQILDILTAVSTKIGGEFSVKIFDAGVEARMIGQKLAMIGIQILDNCTVT